YVSAALFRKEISSFIVNVTAGEDGNGVPCDFNTAPPGSCYNITRPVNGTEEVTINGIEAGAQLALSFLPQPWDGFGVLANLTYQDDKGYEQENFFTGAILPFPGLSEMSYNFSV